MDRRERIDSLHDSIMMALEGFQAQIWTTLPGIVESFDPATCSASVQPAIQVQVQQPDGAFALTSLPLLINCPVIFQSGGGATMTFPVKKGDECLVSFASRCIDGWWQSGDVAPQAEFRMHDLSDGFVIVGPRSVPKVPGGISTSEVQLRSDDGNAYVALNPTTWEIKIHTPGAVNVVATGAVSVTSAASATVTAPSISLGALGDTLRTFVNDLFVSFYNNHVHPIPGGNSGTPVTPMSGTQCSSTVKGG